MLDIIKNAVGYLLSRVLLLGPTLVARILAAMGIGYGVYALALPAFVTFMQSYLSGLDPWIVQLLGALHVDNFLTMVFSAWAAKLGIKVQAIKLSAVTPAGGP